MKMMDIQLIIIMVPATSLGFRCTVGTLLNAISAFPVL